MDNIFFSKKLKQLAVAMAIAWAAFVILLFRGNDSSGRCLNGSADIALSILLIVPLLTGIFIGSIIWRILNWPHAHSSKIVQAIQLTFAVISGIVVAGFSFLILSLSQWGCS